LWKENLAISCHVFTQRWWSSGQTQVLLFFDSTFHFCFVCPFDSYLFFSWVCNWSQDAWLPAVE
jgi:hypothetical protein